MLHFIIPNLDLISFHHRFGRIEHLVFSSDFERTEFLIIRSLHAFRIIEGNNRYMLLERNGFIQRTGRNHIPTAISLIQRPCCQAFTHFLLPGRMHIQGISLIGTYRHTGMRNFFHQPTLAVAEPWP